MCKKKRCCKKKCCVRCEDVIVTPESLRGVEVIADESGPTSTNVDGKGWNFNNIISSPSAKFNWYDFVNSSNDPTLTVKKLKYNWARIIIHSGSTQYPFFTVYTEKQNDGKDAGSFYRSKATYQIPTKCILYDQEFIVYVGKKPPVYKKLPHVRAKLTNFVGPTGQTNFLPTEVVSLISLGSNSTAPTNAVRVTVYTLGYQIGKNCEDLQLETLLT
jgi:hypothetical protein